ncbi:MAG: hypothetical protein ABSF62_13220 [Bryobacteraceae bacterium]
MRFRLTAVCLLACLAAAAQSPSSVRAVVESVREGLRLNHKDSQIAKALRKFKLAERLDDRTIETLESEGAGPATVAELQEMRAASAHLPVPQAPAIEAPPAPWAGEQERVWEAAREKSLSYTESLPDFICTESVKRYKDPEGREQWHLADTLVLKLTYFERKEDYQLISIDNRPTHLTYEQTGGAITEGEFGSLLGSIFAESSRTEYRWDHWTTLRQRPTHVYRFRIAVENSAYRLSFGTNDGYFQHATMGQHGYVYVDRETNAVVRIAAEAESLPRDFPVKRAGSLLDYGFTDVGGHPYLLPLRSVTRLDALPLQHRNEVQFLDYRKFSSDATVTFGDPVPPVKK